MILCAAQLHAQVGLESNMDRHFVCAEVAAAHGAQALVFPELSLTGYEPERASEQQLEASDSRLDLLQICADEHAITLVAGAALRGRTKPQISVIAFAPQAPRRVYAKSYLHPDEEPFFEPGYTPQPLPSIALAICYELSVKAHAAAHAPQAEWYVVSAAKTASGVAEATPRLQAIAREHRVHVLLANCVGPADGSTGGGRSCAISRDGQVLATLDPEGEGLILFDGHSGQARAYPFANRGG